jgi:hypothetical protein
VLFILPTVVLGPNFLATTKAEVLSTTVRILISLSLGEKPQLLTLPQTVDVRDLAEMVTLGFQKSEEIKAGRYLAATPEHHYAALSSVIGERFAKEVEEGKLSLEGETGKVRLKMDCKATEEEFGIRFRGLEEQVEESLRHFLGLEG